MGNYVKHLDREWDAMGWPKTGDDPQAWIYQNLRELLEAFSKGGHSGSSAPYTVSLFSKLALFKPVGPLTGKPDEWNEVGPGVFQNKRCSGVFMEDGKAHYIDGKVFVDPDGATFTNKESRVPVTFPYTPKTERIRCPSNPDIS